MTDLIKLNAAMIMFRRLRPHSGVTHGCLCKSDETNTSALRVDMQTKAGIKSLPLLSLKTSMLTPYIENISCCY